MTLEPGVYETTFADGVTALWSTSFQWPVPVSMWAVACLDGKVRRANGIISTKRIGRIERDLKKFCELPKGTKLMFTDGGNAQWTRGVDSSPRGIDDYIRDGRVIVLDEPEPQAEPSIPRTFADVRVGQKWQGRARGNIISIVKPAGRELVEIEHNGTEIILESVFFGVPWEKRWKYIGEDEAMMARAIREQFDAEPGVVVKLPEAPYRSPQVECHLCLRPVVESWLLTEDGIGPCCFGNANQLAKKYDPGAEKAACKAKREGAGTMTQVARMISDDARREMADKRKRAVARDQLEMLQWQRVRIDGLTRRGR
jgi:hypothetical protein